MKGKAEGKTEATEYMILNMSKKGFSIQLISELTGLSKEEFEVILEKDDG